MKTIPENSESISRLTGEFIDSGLEYDFQSYILRETIRYSRRYILTFGLLFLLFIIPDYFLIQDQNRLTIIFLIRILFLLVSFLYFLHLPFMKHSLYLFSTIYELIAVVLFWCLFYFYEQPDLVIHQQGLIIFILAIILILHNSFINKVLLSILLTFGFFYIAAARGILPWSSYSTGLITFTVIIILFCALTARLINRLQRIQFQNTQILERLSITDTLTKAYNRMKFNQDLEKEITRAQRYHLSLSAIMFDLDGFKEINDKYGHLVGDQVLIELSSQLKRIIRVNDQLYRLGGDEFIILLPNTTREATLHIVKRIQNSLQNVSFLPVDKVSCSFGVTSWQEDDTVSGFMDRVDQLLYQAKKRGKDCMVSDFSKIAKKR